MPEPETTADVRIRPTVGERALFLLMCSFSPLVLAIFIPEAVLSVPWPVLVGALACLVGADQVVRRNGITLTAEAAVIRSPLWRTKRVRWGHVVAVTIENDRALVLWTQGVTAAGPREATPVDVSHRRRHETYALVNDWWLEHRGY